MFTKKSNQLITYHFKNLTEKKELVHFVSSRIGGVSDPPFNELNLSLTVGDRYEKVINNRKKLLKVFDIPVSWATFANQKHSSNVAIVTKKMRGLGALSYETCIKNTDAMLTNQPGVCLLVLTADCVPIVLYDTKKKIIGVVHSGWRGTASKITIKAVELMIEEFNSRPVDIFVGIGPSIGPDSYEVGMDVIKVFKESYPEDELIRMINKEKGLLDLWKTNFKQLLSLGIPKENIEVAEICTYKSSDIFYSYRKEHPTGLFGTGVMLTN